MADPLLAYLNEETLKAYVLRAIEEDLGSGDATTEALGIQTRPIKARVFAKEPGVAAGLKVAECVFLTLDPDAEFQPLINDGDSFRKGQAIAQIEGHSGAILSGERVALNFLMRLSGIATLTHRFVESVLRTKAKILDTRKTTPGLRLLEKWAVLLGGGQNHRLGLFDMILLKENHIALAGGISQALKLVFANNPSNLPVEIEVRSLGELKEALAFPISRILLDNFELQDIQRAVNLVKAKVPLEVSGGVTLENVRSIAEAGVDFISVGRLTHSAKAIDLSLLIV